MCGHRSSSIKSFTAREPPKASWYHCLINKILSMCNLSAMARTIISMMMQKGKVSFKRSPSKIPLFMRESAPMCCTDSFDALLLVLIASSVMNVPLNLIDNWKRSVSTVHVMGLPPLKRLAIRKNFLHAWKSHCKITPNATTAPLSGVPEESL